MVEIRMRLFPSGPRDPSVNRGICPRDVVKSQLPPNIHCILPSGSKPPKPTSHPVPPHTKHQAHPPRRTSRRSARPTNPASTTTTTPPLLRVYDNLSRRSSHYSNRGGRSKRGDETVAAELWRVRVVPTRIRVSGGERRRCEVTKMPRAWKGGGERHGSTAAWGRELRTAGHESFLLDNHRRAHISISETSGRQTGQCRDYERGGGGGGGGPPKKPQ